MTCHNCRTECRRFEKHRNGLQRFECALCKRTFTVPHERICDNMYTGPENGLLALPVEARILQ